MTLCKIKRVHNDYNANPVLAQVQSSFQSTDHEFQAKFYEDRQKKRALTIQGDECVYNGYLENPKDNLCHTLIAVRKKGSNKITLYNVNKASLSVVRKKIKYVTKSSPTDNMKLKRQAERALLNKQFGTKKAKRTTEIQERMKTNSEAISKDKMDVTIANVDTNLNESELLNTSQTVQLTTHEIPINREATRLEDVYDINDFLTEMDVKDFESDATIVLETKIDDLKVSDYIKEEISKVQNSSDNRKEKIKRITILLYAQSIMEFARTKVVMLKSRSYQIVSSRITSKILRLFTSKSSNGSVTRSLQMRDKAVCYVMALLFIASDNYLVDMEHLSPSIGVNTSRLGQLAKLVGARQKGKCKTLYEIRLPIPELKQETQRSRRKK